MPVEGSLNAEVDVLRDAEAEVARGAEVCRLELVLLHTEAALDELKGLLATHGDMARDLLITADTKLADGVARSGENRLLACELLEHLGGTSKPIPRLADGAVDDELLDVDAPLPCFTLFSGHDGHERCCFRSGANVWVKWLRRRSGRRRGRTDTTVVYST